MHPRYAARAAARFVVQPSREGWPIRRKPARHTHSSALASHRIHRKNIRAPPARRHTNGFVVHRRRQLLHDFSCHLLLETIGCAN
ncbi:hypothetical protein DIJ63_18155 [Burkholderia pseudomallei]|nr:hypothetical protein DIJ63_18155 [Burkholderia pseudomallei]